MGNAAISFVDVGQGDCVVAADPKTGEGVLMDCPAGGESRALAALKKLSVTRLRAAIISHQHLDHLGGVYGVVTSVPTEKVKVNPPTNIPEDKDEKKKLRAAMRAVHGLPRKGISVEPALAGESGSIGEVKWQILGPDTSQLLYAAAGSRPNHASVVLKLSIGGSHVLAGSDADGESWETMAARSEVLSAEILQVPHHGGDLPAAGSSWTLSRIVHHVGADIHVISVGSANNYGHPARSTLILLRSELPDKMFLCTQLNSICADCKVDPNTSCAGDVTFRFEGQWVLVAPDRRLHRERVKQLAAPQCV
jgi:competence protein ComEC